MILNKKWSILLVMVFACGFAACNVHTTTDDNAIQPVVHNIQAPVTGIPLYFSYKNAPFMAPELRNLDQSLEYSIEQLAINELIAGPTEGELQRLIPENTTATTSAVGNTLFVTLSEQFLNTLPGEARNWKNNDSEKNKVLSRRKMAVYSIVNTITEIGRYDRVQILIQDAENPEGYRPKLYDVGLSDADDGKLLDILSRDPAQILTPTALTSEMMSAFQEKQWESIYNNSSQQNSQSIAPVSIYEFEAKAQDSGITLESYTVLDAPVTFTGNSTAIVMVNYTIRNQNNYVSEYTNVPFQLILVNNIWKVEYDSVMKIIDKGTS